MASPLRPEDLALLESLRQGGEWLRAILTTLARKGRAFRAAEPERTRALLDTLSVNPWYKGGQFLFDLMEWEDFMLDGPPPPLVTTALDAAALSRLAQTLDRVKSHLDGGAVSAAVAVVGNPALPELPADLPQLTPSMFLFEDTVLGIVLSALPAFIAQQT